MRLLRLILVGLSILILLGVLVQANEILYRGEYTGISKCFDAKLDVQPFIAIAESIIQTKCPKLDTSGMSLANIQLHSNYNISSTVLIAEKIKSEPKSINVTVDYVLMNTGRFSVSTSMHGDWEQIEATYDQIEISFTTFPKNTIDPNPMVIIKKGIYESIIPKPIKKKN
ncbi:MAG: hypothetical protein ACE14V_00340 [bacterium]